MITYETSQARTIVKSTRYAMLHDDRESLANIIDNIGSQENVEHVRIFNKKGLIMFSSNHSETGRLLDKNAAGCVECHSGPVPSATLGDMKQARRFINEKGKDVIAITAPIYNEPSCYQAACHVHTAEQKILGTLDIGLSSTPLVNNLSVMRSRMAVFSIMDYTEKTIEGIEQEIPPCGTEIETLAGNIRSIVGELNSLRQEKARWKKEE
jgi:hypothetical protein